MNSCNLKTRSQDELRFVQQGTSTNLWIQHGSLPTAVRQTEYQYLRVIRAVLGHAEGLLSPQLNAKIISTFLEQFSAMIWGGAGFLTAKARRVTLVPLPPYSPELNPIINLWHYLNSHYWGKPKTANYTALEECSDDNLASSRLLTWS